MYPFEIGDFWRTRGFFKTSTAEIGFPVCSRCDKGSVSQSQSGATELFRGPNIRTLVFNFRLVAMRVPPLPFLGVKRSVNPVHSFTLFLHIQFVFSEKINRNFFPKNVIHIFFFLFRFSGRNGFGKPRWCPPEPPELTV